MGRRIEKEYIRPGEAMRLAGPGGNIIKAWVVKGVVRGYFTEGGHLYIHRQSLLDHVAMLERKAARKPEPKKFSGTYDGCPLELVD